MGKLDPNRRINLHGTVNTDRSYKSYRTEATPISNSISTIVIIWSCRSIYEWRHNGERFEIIWPWDSVGDFLIFSALVFATSFYSWFKFKMEDNDKN